jgi:hypothetical protein
LARSITLRSPSDALVLASSGAQALHFLEARDRHVEHRLDALGGEAVDHVGADAGAHRLLDQAGIRGVDEHHDRQRLVAADRAHALERVAARAVHVDDDDVGPHGAHPRHQVLARRHGGDDLGIGGEQPGFQHRSTRRIFVDHEHAQAPRPRLKPRAGRCVAVSAVVHHCRAHPCHPECCSAKDSQSRDLVNGAGERCGVSAFQVSWGVNAEGRKR